MLAYHPYSAWGLEYRQRRDRGTEAQSCKLGYVVGRIANCFCAKACPGVIIRERSNECTVGKPSGNQRSGWRCREQQPKHSCADVQLGRVRYRETFDGHREGHDTGPILTWCPR